jgi:uncharacterized phage protein (TIGR02218 family)
MLELTTALAAHFLEEVTTLAVCWRIERTDDLLILGTQHDRSITVVDDLGGDYAGTYLAQAGITGSDIRSSSDMSVDNSEVSGVTSSDALVLPNLSVADIEAGLFDGASVTLFLLNWAAPDDGRAVLRTGRIGEISRTSDGRYRTELRGLAQNLTQVMVRTYGAQCDAELGDSRCTVDLGPLTMTGTVMSVTNRRLFTVALSGTPTESTLFDGGLLTWTAGDNATYTMEVKRLTDDTVLNLFLPMWLDVQVGDTFTIRPGCDKSPAMCKGRFANLVNFRGHGAWVPGIGEMSVFGGQTAPRSERSPDFLAYPRAPTVEP